MKKDLISKMKCPYCLNHFEISKTVEQRNDRIIFGLIRCHCFEFPIIDGVLLLSLSKGYGGTVEALEPYVPLQIAAIEFLKKDDIQGLLRWIDRHIPLLSYLYKGRFENYLDYMKQHQGRLQQKIEKDMFAIGRYDFLGKKGYMRLNLPKGMVLAIMQRLWATRLGTFLVGIRYRFIPDVFDSFFVSRFASPQISSIRLNLKEFPLDGPILSLCCGQGIFELLVRGLKHDADIVSIDGQILNLFVVKKYIHPEGNYICHDLQFPLPFPDGVFNATFSSTCLPEIPSQATFIKEAVRVTTNDGWTMFDGVWHGEKARIWPMRHYRFCQNEMAKLIHYYELIRTCSGNRVVKCLCASKDSSDQKERWYSDPDTITYALEHRSENTASFVVSEKFPKVVDYTSKSIYDFSANELASLSLNPRYEIHDREDGEIHLHLCKPLPGLSETISIDRSKLKDERYLENLYQSGVLVLLPSKFSKDIEMRRVATKEIE